MQILIVIERPAHRRRQPLAERAQPRLGCARLRGCPEWLYHRCILESFNWYFGSCGAMKPWAAWWRGRRRVLGILQFIWYATAMVAVVCGMRCGLPASTSR